MSGFFSDILQNSSLFETCVSYWGGFVDLLVDAFENLGGFQAAAVDIPDYLHFNDFQWLLFKTFLIILVINLILIFVAWRVYRKSVCERFMRPVTSKAIEELKASVSRLKLPKEHTPRI